MIENEKQDSDAWRMFRIMGEFAKGFEILDGLPNYVAMFGSARTVPDDPYYIAAVEIARRLAERGLAVVTGGGPGIMEAGNRGASLAGGKSIGLCIDLPHEQQANPYINVAIHFHYFFVRKVMFLKRACGIIVMPGGFGTMDEMWETATLVQTDKIADMPIVLYGTRFWSGLLDWVRQQMHAKNAYVDDMDPDLFTLTDDPDEVLAAFAGCGPQQSETGIHMP